MTNLVTLNNGKATTTIFLLDKTSKLVLYVNQGGKMSRKQISFSVSDEEHEQIKVLASRERKTIKQLILEAISLYYPDWKKEDSKEKK